MQGGEGGVSRDVGFRMGCSCGGLSVLVYNGSWVCNWRKGVAAKNR